MSAVGCGSGNREKDKVRQVASSGLSPFFFAPLRLCVRFLSTAIVHGPGAVGAASRRFPRRFRAQIPIHEAARGRSYQPVNAYLSTLSSARLSILAFSGAVLLWASLPPLDWWLLAWIAPVPWVLLIRRERLDGRRPYTVLWLAGFATWMGTLHFLRLPHWATSFGWVVLSGYFAFYVPLFVGLSRVAVHRLRVPVMLAAPVVWTGLELARGHLFTGMTMACLGHTQYRWIDLIQVSDLAGAYGVSFVVMLVAAALARTCPIAPASPNAVSSRQGGPLRRAAAAVWPLVPAAAVLAAAVFYGRARMGGESLEPGPRIALVQGSIDVEMRYDPDMRDRIFNEYYGLSREAVEKHRNIDLLIWPETMFVVPLVTFDADASRPPGFDGDDAEFQKQLREIVEADKKKTSTMARTAALLGVPLLLGVDTQHVGRESMKCFNSAAYVARDGRLLGRYDKMHLVMFGEYVPFADRFPWLQRLTPLPISATPGKEPAAFELPAPGARASRPLEEPQASRPLEEPQAGPQAGQPPEQMRAGRPRSAVRIAPNICYESVLSHVIRGQVNSLAAEGREPDVLVNLTNDGWFWGSSELDLHLICGVFRAVECRKPLLVAANTGFSAWIDGDGRIVAQGPRREKAVIIAEPGLDRRRSWYLEHGDWFAGICLAGCLLFGGIGLHARIRGVSGRS
jgi:apolipoprotein N-acyltransferase